MIENKFHRIDFKGMLEDIDEEVYDDYIKNFTEYIKDSFLNGTVKKYIDNPYETYDISGSLNNTYEKYNINDYNTIEDFIENEYTGESVATYISGCGMSYPTYKDEIERNIIDAGYEACAKEIKDITKLNDDEIMDYMDEYDEETFEEFIMDFQHTLSDKFELFTKNKLKTLF